MALRFQFRLRALLVFVSLTSLGSGILARLYDQDRRERVAVRIAYALGDDALALLAGCPQLRVIEVSSASISDRGARALGGAQRLEEVIMCGDITPDGADSLFALPCLKHLIVHGRGDFWGHWTREPDGRWRLLGGGIPTKNPATTE